MVIEDKAGVQHIMHEGGARLRSLLQELDLHHGAPLDILSSSVFMQCADLTEGGDDMVRLSELLRPIKLGFRISTSPPSSGMRARPEQLAVQLQPESWALQLHRTTQGYCAAAHKKVPSWAPCVGMYNTNYLEWSR